MAPRLRPGATGKKGRAKLVRLPKMLESKIPEWRGVRQKNDVCNNPEGGGWCDKSLQFWWTIVSSYPAGQERQTWGLALVRAPLPLCTSKAMHL
jgi:hypothetical protein